MSGVWGSDNAWTNICESSIKILNFSVTIDKDNWERIFWDQVNSLKQKKRMS